MKLLIDFFPILLFFVAFKLWGIYVATAVAIVATIVQIAWLRYSTGKVEPMQWLSLGVIVLFGGATIVSQSETFIKWKPTVLYWLMGGALLAGQLIFRKNLLKSLMGAQMTLPDAAWRVMNWSWIGFFAAMGVLNLWVAYNFDTDTWVNFKLFGGLGLMGLFVVCQALYLSRYMKEQEAQPTPAREP
ncbi:MAG TPA: septation protein A [Ramlibacter sp.]|nr:septation protein A [Ramlibacter sp.]